MAKKNKVVSVTFSSNNVAYLNEVAVAIKTAVSKIPRPRRGGGDPDISMGDPPDGGWGQQGGWFQVPNPGPGGDAGWGQQGGWVLLKPEGVATHYTDPAPPLDKLVRDVFKAVSRARDS